MMRIPSVSSILLVFCVVSLFALSPFSPPPCTAEEASTGLESAKKEPGWLGQVWKDYTRHMDAVIKQVIEMDIWGISTPQLPKGILKLKLRSEHQKATQKYENGKKVPIAPSVAFPNPFGEGDLLFVDLQGDTGGGEGWGHTIQVSYGILDPLDWYIEFPFQRAEVRFDVKYRPGSLMTQNPPLWNAVNNLVNIVQAASGGPPIDLATEEGFWRFVEALGRPRLKTHYMSDGWDLGDIHTGFSWNYIKWKHFAAATTGRVYLPTGFQPDADNDIELFTGAGFPAGVRAWGLSTTQGFDFRLPDPLDWVIFNLEFTYEYRFRTRRPAPTFPKRSPLWDKIFDALIAGEPDIAALFPDLSDMGDYYWITYGHSFDGEIGVVLNPFQILPIGVKYAGGWTQKPKIESTSKDFVNYVETVEIVGEQAQQVVAFGTGISLIPFYIPLNISFEYRIPIWGHGSFVIEENYAITGEFFITF